ncbi:MAG: hypothetical protein ACC619_06290, partial [Paracoccaceae bacterium]
VLLAALFAQPAFSFTNHPRQDRGIREGAGVRVYGTVQIDLTESGSESFAAMRARLSYAWRSSEALFGGFAKVDTFVNSTGLREPDIYLGVFAKTDKYALTFGSIKSGWDKIEPRGFGAVGWDAKTAAELDTHKIRVDADFPGQSGGGLIQGWDVRYSGSYSLNEELSTGVSFRRNDTTLLAGLNYDVGNSQVDSSVLGFRQRLSHEVKIGGSLTKIGNSKEYSFGGKMALSEKSTIRGDVTRTDNSGYSSLRVRGVFGYKFDPKTSAFGAIEANKPDGGDFNTRLMVGGIMRF